MSWYTLVYSQIHFYIFRLFGAGGSCSACAQTIPASELVMKAQGNVYHLKCFTCVSCHSQLVPGDRYSIVNGSLFCEQDYPKGLKGHMTGLPNRTSHKVGTVLYQDTRKCIVINWHRTMFCQLTLKIILLRTYLNILATVKRVLSVNTVNFYYILMRSCSYHL